MVNKPSYLWILPVIWVAVMCETTPTQTVDMESSDCDRSDPYTIDDQDILRITADPPRRPGMITSRNRCVVVVEAPTNRRLKLHIVDAYFPDRGNRLEIYDGADHMTRPEIVLPSETSIKLYDTRTEAVQFALLKNSLAANVYRISILVTTDQGPDVDFEQAMSSWTGNALSIGAIVGISVSAGLIVIALIAIFIYCALKNKKRNADTYDKEDPQPVYKTDNSKVVFPSHKSRSHGYETSSNDSRSSMSSGEGNVFVSMNPGGKTNRRDRGHQNQAYTPSEDGGHDRSRDSTGSEDTGGYTNASFESNETPTKMSYKKHHDGSSNGSISRSGRRGSARSKSNRKRTNSTDDKLRPSRDSRDGSMRRSRSGHRDGHRDSSRRRSRSHGERGSQRRTRSHSPHSQSSRDSSVYDKDGKNRMYSVSTQSRQIRDSSTSSRDSGDERKVSYDPNPPRRSRRDRDLEYGSQV